jgi:hypothetical protein
MFLVMASKGGVSTVRAMLKAVQLEIELLQKTVEEKPYDKESRKRLREAKNQESVILAKLSEWTLN